MGDIARAIQLLDEAAHAPDRLENLLVEAGRVLGFDHVCIQRSETSAAAPASSELQGNTLHVFGLRDGKLVFSKGVVTDPAAPRDVAATQASLEADVICLDVIDRALKNQLAYGVGWQFAAEGSTWSVTLARAEAQGPVSDEEAHEVARIMPAANRVLRLLKRLHDAHFNGLFDGLAATQTAAVLFRLDGSVGRITPVAQQLFNIDFRMNEGRLWSADGSSNAHLEALVGHARAPQRQKALKPFLIRRFNQHRSILAQPAVVDGISGHAEPNARLALFLSAPGQTVMVSEDDLQLLFGLSKAEARIARLLASGLEPQQIAEHRSVSVGTIRVQMKHIFQKMNVHRQGELIRTIADLRPPCRTLVGGDAHQGVST